MLIIFIISAFLSPKIWPGPYKGPRICIQIIPIMNFYKNIVQSTQDYDQMRLRTVECTQFASFWDINRVIENCSSSNFTVLSIFTCPECKRHRNEDPHHYEHNIYHKTRKEYSQIEANFCIYANYKETSDVYAWYVPCYEPVLTFINLLISLYKCHNCMLRLYIHILEIWTYYRQGKNNHNISQSFSTLSVLFTDFCVMISYLFYYQIMTDKAKTYVSAGPYRRAVQHYLTTL